VTAQPTDADLQRTVVRYLARPDIRGNLELLDSRLPEAAHLYVAGGAPRNAIIAALHGSAPPTQDIDIFIGGVGREFWLSDLLKDQQIRPTDLKGLRWQPAGSRLAYDISLLGDFFLIDHYQLEPTLENFLECIDFTINAVVFDVRQQLLHDAGCAAAVRARMIAFNSHRMPDKVLIAYRILLMAHKTRFRLAEPVFNFLRCRLDLDTVRQLKGLLHAKAGKTVAAAIMASFDDVCCYHTYDAYCAG
jgi:hypothetical protein